MRRRRKIPDKGQAPPLLGARIPMISLIQTLAVAEYLNFRYAANFLGVSPSSVSERIKTLENLLGGPIPIGMDFPSRREHRMV